MNYSDQYNVTLNFEQGVKKRRNSFRFYYLDECLILLFILLMRNWYDKSKYIASLNNYRKL